MEQAQLVKRQERARTETFVIRELEDGFQIYAPARPDRRYLVSGSSEAPTCTCPDFENNAHDPEWRCKHILAVFNRESDRDQQDNGRSSRHGNDAPSARTRQDHSGPRMILKRSVSPDGRIDALSVEFAIPVDPGALPAVKALAARTLRLQSEIVGGFLDGNGRTNGGPSQGQSTGNGAVPAELLNIGGIDTKYGRRLFINVRCNGKVLKLFGSNRRLAEAVQAAGFPDAAQFIEEGLQLNLPCRVTTKPSDDGRYVNVDAVFPRGQDGARP